MKSVHHDHSQLQVQKLTKRCEVYQWKWTVLDVSVGGGLLVSHVNSARLTSPWNNDATGLAGWFHCSTTANDILLVTFAGAFLHL